MAIDARIEIRGSSKSWWVRLPGEPARWCGDADDTTKEQAIAHATALAEAHRREEEAERRLRARQVTGEINLLRECPDYIDPATWPDGAGTILAVFGKRRRKVGGVMMLRITDYEKVV